MRSRAETTSRTTSTSSNDESTVFCMLVVSASIGRWKPGRSASTSCQSGPLATPKIRRRVVFGTFDVIATLSPQSALTSVDLPTFGRPGDGDEARLHARSPASNCSGSSSSTVIRTIRPPLRKTTRSTCISASH